MVSDEPALSTLSDEPADDTFSVRDGLGDFFGFFSPFIGMTADIPAMPQPDEFVPLEFDDPASPWNEIGTVPQPERYEQLQPHPVEVKPLPQAFEL